MTTNEGQLCFDFVGDCFPSPIPTPYYPFEGNVDEPLRSTKDIPRKTKGAAGYDLSASIHTAVWNEPTLVPTGVHVAIPEGHVGLLSLRSSLGMAGYTLANGVGIIDSDYRGEIAVMLQYNGGGVKYIFAGDRIAQLLIVPIATPAVVVCDSVEDLGETARGSGGFGSTGV